MKELIHAYKFQNQKTLKIFFVKLMAEFIARHLQAMSFDAMASVPLDPKKENARGYNQSSLIGAQIAKHLKLPDLSAQIGRRPSASAQAALGKEERAANVVGCFFTVNGSKLHDRDILLVDDILTTGHTASECARVLKASGARSVTALALARGL